MNKFEYSEELDKDGLVIAINLPSGTKEMEFEVVDFGFPTKLNFICPDVFHFAWC